jgi:hypothetical protein
MQGIPRWRVELSLSVGQLGTIGSRTIGDFEGPLGLLGDGRGNLFSKKSYAPILGWKQGYPFAIMDTLVTGQ